MVWPDDVAKQVKWQTAEAANDDLYAKRQKSAKILANPHSLVLLQGILSSDRGAQRFFFWRI